jgi:hypothetical protein
MDKLELCDDYLRRIIAIIGVLARYAEANSVLSDESALGQIAMILEGVRVPTRPAPGTFHVDGVLKA